MSKPRGYWDIKDNVFKEAKKYQTRSEFSKWCGSAYDAARKHNWLGEMNWFVNGHVKYAKEKRIAEKLSKPVLQIDKNTNEVIAEYPSLREVERQTGFNNSSISKCCNNKPKYNTAYGYKWKYK